MTPEQLKDFFVDWPNPPTEAKRLDVLKGSYAVWFAFHENRLIGFINAISDGVFYAHIPLLEVLPEYKGKGIGSELVRLMKDSLSEMYAVDIVCDPPLKVFYKQRGFVECSAMVSRCYENQSAGSKS
ncbi:GNAT family N-acetyltransferase [Veronia nyctiphanis]|uniref:GNAT family N-acetyltransferase n=1 Tax=Veronia nyctiphanis TaxID=1278244 RepID=UPI00191C03FB|nr:GNAT family N-acetyltransferase [Veronia nyctiphanis]